MAATDIGRSTSGVNLPAEVSAEIFQGVQYASAVTKLARKVPLPGAGAVVDVITGEPAANWTTETDEKPVSNPTVSSKVLRGYTLAVIETFSNQFKRDKNALYEQLIGRLPGAIAKKFDNTVFAASGAPGSDFDQLGGATAVAIAGNTYGGLVSAYTAVTGAGGTVDGWVLNGAGVGILLTKLDGSGRPLFNTAVSTDEVPLILGAPTYVTTAALPTGTPNTVGVAGDWSKAVYGVVEALDISLTDQATVNNGGTAINLWQRNMFAVRAEVEIGFRVESASYFRRLTDGTFV